MVSNTRKATFHSVFCYWPCFLLLLFLASSSLKQQGTTCNAELQEPSPDSLDGDACASLVLIGKCEEEPKLMADYCATTYFEYENSKKEMAVKFLKDDDGPSFYDLSANTIQGTPTSFRKFEGYITMVAFVPKACDDGVAADESLQTLTAVRAIWPMVVEIIAFPFEHPDAHDYATELDCSTDRGLLSKSNPDHYEVEFEKRSATYGATIRKKGSHGRFLNAMEEISIHDKIDSDSSNATTTTHRQQHSVYKYFKNVFGFSTISASSSTVFLVSPDGDRVEVFYDGLAKNVEDSIRQHIERDL